MYRSVRDLKGCAPQFLNLGDGGNREGPYTPWRQPQPEWSAFRESSFGVGKLAVHNGTAAEYTWQRHACGSADKSGPAFSMNFSAATCETPSDNSASAMLTTDSAWLIKPPRSQCPNRFRSGADATGAAAAPAVRSERGLLQEALAATEAGDLARVRRALLKML